MDGCGHSSQSSLLTGPIHSSNVGDIVHECVAEQGCPLGHYKYSGIHAQLPYTAPSRFNTVIKWANPERSVTNCIGVLHLPISKQTSIIVGRNSQNMSIQHGSLTPYN